MWPKRERFVNQVLYAVLLAMPPEAMNRTFMSLMPELTPLAEPTLCKGTSRKLGEFIGEPDFVMLDRHGKKAVIGEIKIGATKVSNRYTFHQYTKYMLYAALLRAAGIADHVAHVIVVPDTTPKRLCKDYKKWEPV